MGSKQTGGAILAFAGFVFLIGAVKGTWKVAWKDLTGGTSVSTTAPTAPGLTGPQGKPSAVTGKVSGGSAGTASSNLPGSPAAPYLKGPVG